MTSRQNTLALPSFARPIPLQPAEKLDGRDARIRFITELNDTFRFRHAVGSGMGGPAFTNQVCGVYLAVESLEHPWMQSADASGVEDNQYCLMTPFGPDPVDSTGVHMRMPTQAPFGVDVYATQYGKYIVESVTLELEHRNMSPVDYICGMTVVPGLIYYDRVDSDKFVEGKDVGSLPVSTALLGQNPEWLKRQPGTVWKVLKGTGLPPSAGQHDASNRAVKSTFTKYTIPVMALKNQVTKFLQGDKFDLEAHGGVFDNPPVKPAAFKLTQGIQVFLWVAVKDPGFVDFAGTSAVSGDTGAQIATGVWHSSDSSNVRGWTEEIGLRGKMTQTVKLYNPLHREGGVSTTGVDIATNV